jgi:hypothetical protein
MADAQKRIGCVDGLPGYFSFSCAISGSCTAKSCRHLTNHKGDSRTRGAVKGVAMQHPMLAGASGLAGADSGYIRDRAASHGFGL